MQLIGKTVERHEKLVAAVDEFLTQMTAYNLLPALGCFQDPHLNPMRQKVYQDLIAACHDAKSFQPYDVARIRGLDAEIDTLRNWGNKDCTAMADSQGGISESHKNLHALFDQCDLASDLSHADDIEDEPDASTFDLIHGGTKFTGCRVIDIQSADSKPIAESGVSMKMDDKIVGDEDACREDV